MSNKNKAGIALLVTILIAAFLWPRLRHSFGEEEQESGPRTVQAEAIVLESSDASREFSANGNILPDESVELQAEISGRIENINFNEGEYVEEGQLLVKINDSELQAERKRLASRESLLEKRTERQKSLLEADGISQESFDNTYYELQEVRADLENVQARIDKTTIRAPFSGEIGIREISPGSYVSPEASIATIVRHQPVKVEFTVPERFASHVQKDDSIRFSVTGIDTPHKARVYARQSYIDQETRSLRIRAIYENEHGLILPGAFASIAFNVTDFPDAITIPNIAVIPEIDGHHVFTYQNGKASKQEVNIGTRDDKYIHITDGLSKGDTLLVTGILNLSDGVNTEITDFQQVSH